MSKSNSSSGSRSSFKYSASSRSKSMLSAQIDMFPSSCSDSFVNRVKKATLQNIAEELGLEWEWEDDTGEYHDFTKAELCKAISSNLALQGKVATRKIKRTKRRVKNARAAPKKAAHKS